MGYNLFQPSTLAMKSQAHALNTIGTNVANVNTGGYKRTDTRFETLISSPLSHQSDLGGVKPKDYQRIDSQGFFSSTGRQLDLAINGDGFFYLSPTFEVTDEIYFTRDGSFEVSLADAQTSNVTASDGSTITVNNGYLVDKNGYYVLGAPVNATDGTFSTDQLTPIRVDEWAFADRNTPTSTAALGLNLPSTNEYTADHLQAVLAGLAGVRNDNLETYHVEMVDSNGNKRSAQLNFTKQANNVWQVSASTPRASSPQISTVNFAGTAEAGDTYSITLTIGGRPTTVSYTSDGTEGGLSGIRDALIASINADETIAASVAASAGNGNGEITLRANDAATSFSPSATASDGTRAQVDTITISGTPEVGDVYEFTLASPDNNIVPQTISYEVTAEDVAAGLSGIRDAIIEQFMANDPASASVIAAAGNAPGEIILTARTAGRSFTTDASTPATGATADNEAAVETTRENATGTADNAVTIASNTSTQTSAVQTLRFNNHGSLLEPQSMDFTLSFDDGATSTFAMNLSKMTQYGSDFSPYSYSHNGLASTSMREVNFDTTGQVLGKFADGTNRAIYKLPLAIFVNPDQLEMINGMLFRETTQSGAPTETFADTSGRASFVTHAFEISNVDLATEFTRMIMVQKAYNSSATVFRTVDEMVQTGRDLKA